ncbi:MULTISPECIES: beta-ketoacyl synthase N-terminal-like domain-containing protein [spotted fever group]|uniref:Polyketide synthase PksR n=1 Tax=Rickettsia tamurae subsp. buchneri TaxID=1462938 RepID=A0A8E1BZH7_9RICK|nr:MULTISPECIES: beta-ketoacyl synthase N-terminal-like domain-containing protein [spotted fever group]KDO02436.1 Polyketide synthase PksR [Rickettsia tamurae subsp. buchneri]
MLSRYDRLIKAINAIPKTDQIDKSEILHDYPWLVGHINLLDKCISKYAEILTGKIDYMSVLFPDGKFDLVEPIYRDNPISDYYNIKVSEIVENYINSRLTHHPIRIIEIGAGTGSTTKFVLPKLREKDSYYYTDLSIAFLKKAKNEFNGFQNVKYDICNIEEDSKEDLIGSFDILIATNVLHATKNIKRTIANVRKYVKTDGIAIINEVTEISDFATLTFGLTPGWWLYSDSRIIDSPLIDSNIWKEILRKNNFIEVKFYGNQGQKVIVALAGKTNLDNNFTCDNTIQESVSKISYDVNSSNRDYNKDIANSVEKFITKNISQIMKIPHESLNVTTAFANYGIDSLIVLELAKPFKEIYKELPTTIFFEYSTISNLKNYLLKEYKEESEKAFKTSKEVVIQSSKDIKPTMIDDNRFKTWLKDTICHVIRIDPKELNENTPFANYGIDSLITLEIVKLIANKLGYLPNTIFFEHTTLNSLYTYLIGQYSEKIKENFVVTESTSSKPPQNLEPSSLSQRNENDLAVIGLSGKFPKAKNIDEFWNNLVNGLNCTTAIPLERWNNSEFYDPEGGLGKIYTNYGCFIEDVEYFDNKFFQITPFDAENIDPQERLFLQTTYHAIENSGYKVSDLKGSNIGVFVGIMNVGYSWLGIDTDKMNWADTLYWSVANRVSYNFDWHGPSMAVDTACSSSLTAIHLACQSIQNGESTMAIAGGVNLILHPKQYCKLCRLRMLSKRLECRSFGENADGFVDGEGIAAIFLKPLNQAIKIRIESLVL